MVWDSVIEYYSSSNPPGWFCWILLLLGHIPRGIVIGLVRPVDVSTLRETSTSVQRKVSKISKFSSSTWYAHLLHTPCPFLLSF